MSTTTKRAPKVVGPTTKKSILKVGSILSETSFYVVKSFTPGGIVTNDDHGNEINLSNNYVEKILASADYFTSEEKKTVTEMQEIFLASPRIAMTICFTTKPTEKLVRDYNAEKATKIAEIKNARVSDVESLLENLIENPITREIPGQLRVMKGRHYGSQDTGGRVSFIDMEEKQDTSKDYDTRTRKVDPRTIEWIITGGVKYSKK